MKTINKWIKKAVATMPFCLMACLPLMTACSDDDPFSTASSNDEPRILDPIFPDWENGKPGSLSVINRDMNFNMTLTVTPADYCNVTWLIDGVQVAEGKTIDMALLRGVYRVHVNVETVEGKSTYREAMLTVNPLPGDPELTDNSSDLLLAPGGTFTIPGKNLKNVKKLIVNGNDINVSNATDNSITVSVPSIADGNYRAILVDDKGAQYGVNTLVTVSSKPYVNESNLRCNSGADVTLTGINLGNIASITVGDKAAAIVSQSFSNLVFTCPSLSEGDFKLTAKAKDGSDVLFAGATSTTITLTKETTLLEGRFVIDWDASICSVPADQFANVPVGAKLKIYYEVPDAEYHNLRIITPWWNDVPGGAQIDVTPDTPNPYVLEVTDEFKGIVAEQGAVACVGFGYTVTRITFE